MSAPVGPAAPGTTLQWTGTGSPLRDNAMPMGVAALSGIAGTTGVGLVLNRGERVLTNRSLGFMALGGVLAAGAGFGAAAGIRHLVEDGAPPAVDASLAHPLPAATTPAEAPGHPVPASAQGDVGEASGHYYVQVPHTRTYTTTSYSNGQSHTTTHTETYYTTERRHFDDELRLREQVGRFDGYASKEAALADVAGRGPVAVVADGGRDYLYRTSDTRWGHIDDLRVGASAVQAIVSDEDTVWQAASRGSDEFREGGENRSAQPVRDLTGDNVGRFQELRRGDPDLDLRGDLGPGSGYGSLAEALGDAAARPDDQAVVHDGDGRFHVLATDGTHDADPTATLQGIRTAGSASSVDAIEIDGAQYVPSGDWYVATPRS